jgi:hypothetical protein
MIKFTFAPYKLTDGRTQEDDICDYCMEEMWAEDHGLEDWPNMYEECTCGDSDMDEDDWKAFHYGLISHTDALGDFLHNDNREWMENIRQKWVTVHCSFEKLTKQIEFKIACEEPLRQARMRDNVSSNAESAWNLLEGWGMLDLPLAKEMSFEIGFEVETKIEEGSRELKSSEIHITRILRPARSG